MAFERVEAAGPVRSIWAEPRVQLGQRLGAEVVDAPLGVDADIDEAGVAQHAQVPGDAGLMHARDLHELADRTVVLAHMVEDAPSCRFGDHLQDVELRDHGGQYMSRHIYVKSEYTVPSGDLRLRQTLRRTTVNVSAADLVPSVCDRRFDRLTATCLPKPGRVAGRHHFRVVDEASGADGRSRPPVARVRAVTEAGNTFDYVSFPEMGHSMHGQDPQRYVDTLTEWAVGLSS